MFPQLEGNPRGHFHVLSTMGASTKALYTLHNAWNHFHYE